MKELLSTYIDRGTWKNFELVPLGGGGRVAKYEIGGIGENKDMKYVNMLEICINEHRSVWIIMRGVGHDNSVENFIPFLPLCDVPLRK